MYSFFFIYIDPIIHLNIIVPRIIGNEILKPV